MKPDRSNYEIWLIDWSEGKLSDQEIKLLQSFLDENPDLKRETEGMSFPVLSPPENYFNKKEQLKKSPEDLDIPQIEYLSVGWLENDLSPEQAAELKQSISKNNKNKVLFDSIQKTKLKPVPDVYKYKKLLKKRSARAKILRLSVVRLSVAATIAIMVLSILFVPRYFRGNNTAIVGNVRDTNNIQPFVIMAEVLRVPFAEEKNQGTRGKKVQAPAIKEIPVIAENIQSKIMISDSIVSENNTSVYRITTIPAVSEITFAVISPRASLITTSIKLEEPVYDQERSKLGKFIARTLRQKVLKDKLPDDSPLKGYEYAEVGIAGLNKLFGWEMELVKTNDANGELKSFYFSSKVLKFNAPIKKAQPAL
jgi:hypothetical protein